MSELDYFVVCRICGKRDLIWGGYLDYPYLVHPLTGAPHICNPSDVLQAFADWLRRNGPGDADLRVWGNSPSFDCLKVERAMGRLGIATPWRYYNERCYRTVRERAPSVELDERQGLHNALEDAKYQASHLLKIAATRRARSAA